MNLLLALCLTLFIHWMLKNSAPSKDDTRLIAHLTREFTTLTSLIWPALAAMSLLQLFAAVFISWPSTRFETVSKIEGVLDSLSALLGALIIPTPALLAILLTTFVVVILLHSPSTPQAVERQRSFVILTFTQKLASYQKAVIGLQVMILVASCVTFFEYANGSLRDISKARLIWASEHIVSLQTAADDRVTKLALDQALRSKPRKFPLDYLPPLGRPSFLARIHSLNLVEPKPLRQEPRKLLEEARSRKAVSGNSARPPNWQGWAGQLSKHTIDRAWSALSEPLFKPGFARGEIERTKAESELYRHIVKASAEHALDPARVSAVSALLAEIPLAMPVVDALSAALRETLLEALGSRQLLPLNSLLAGRSEILRWIDQNAAARAKIISTNLPFPDDKLEAKVQKIIQAKAARVEKPRFRGIPPHFQIAERSRPIEERLESARRAANEKYAADWTRRPRQGRYSLSGDAPNSLSRQFEAPTSKTADSGSPETFIAVTGRSTRRAEPSEKSVGWLLTQAFLELELMPPARAHFVLNEIYYDRPAVSQRSFLARLSFSQHTINFSQIMSVMADVNPSRFGLAAGQSGDPRFKRLAEEYLTRQSRSSSSQRPRGR